VPSESRIGGLEILRNAELVDVGTFNKALPIDGGTYTISARAPGNAEWSTTVTVGNERDTKSIEVPKLKAALGTSTNPPVPSHETPPQTDGSNVVPFVVGAGALALIGGAIGFDLWGNATYNDAKAEMTDQMRRDSLYSSANDKRYVAVGLAVAGVATAGVAVWLFLRHPDDERPTTSASKLVITPMGIALVGGF
jgi:hypothetical protein